MESGGQDGVALWVDLREREATYTVGGNDLESDAIQTRRYTVEGTVRPDGRVRFEDDWELLVQGPNGCAFVRRKAARLNFRQKRWEGQLAVFNSSKTAREHPSGVEVHFLGVHLTFLDPPKLHNKALDAVRGGGVEGGPGKLRIE